MLARLVVKNATVVDRSDRMLVMEHELFRHLEIELFVPTAHLARAARLVQDLLDVFAGTTAAPPAETAADLKRIGMLDELLTRCGTFAHHYPITFRKVLPDDALIATSAGGATAWYAVSFITYAEPRNDFLAAAAFLARSMARLFGARPHWGKYFPLSGEEVESLYPRLGEFRDVCRRVDPRGVFRNPFVRRVLFGDTVSVGS